MKRLWWVLILALCGLMWAQSPVPGTTTILRHGSALPAQGSAGSVFILTSGVVHDVGFYACLKPAGCSLFSDWWFGGTIELIPLGVATLGGVKGTGTSLTCPTGQVSNGFQSDGTLNCVVDQTGGGSYTLPAVQSSTLGGVKGTGSSLTCPAGNFSNGFASDGGLNCGTINWGTIQGTLSGQTDLQAAFDAKVSTGVTVNGHPLSSNVVVSAADLTTGTLPHARLPALLSGDIPNNAANTSGTAGALGSTPTTCSAGQAARGVLANGNATGCFTPPGSGSGSSGAAGLVQFAGAVAGTFSSDANLNYAANVLSAPGFAATGTATADSMTEVAAPATPTGSIWDFWMDSTNHIPTFMGAAGTKSNTVVPLAAVAGTCVTGLGVNGVLSTASCAALNVNGSPVSSPNLNGTTPAASSGNQNVTFQVTGSNITGEVPTPAYLGAIDAIGAGGASQTIVLTGGSVQTVTLSANLTIGFTQPSGTTGMVRIRITQAASGGPYTVTWTAVKWPGGIAPVMSASASAIDWYSCLLDGTTTWCTAGQNFQ